MTISTIELLKSYRVDVSKLALTDFNVADNANVTLSTRDPKLAQYVRFVTPQSIVELKTMLGVANTAFAKTSGIAAAPTKPLNPVINPQVVATGKVKLPQSVAALTVTDQAHRFLFSDSTKIDAAEVTKLNQWVITQKIKIPIFYFKDITIGNGATLNVAALSLLARNITIGKNGVLKTGTICKIYANQIVGQAKTHKP